MHTYKTLVLVILILSLVSCLHPLHKFQHQIEQIKAHHRNGDTSNVYTLFMKIFIRTQTLGLQMGINPPQMLNLPANNNCQFMMDELVALLSASHWIDIFHQIYPRLHNIQQKCTSSDFTIKSNSNGFDDQCALCSVLTRVIQNYVGYHRKDVAKFVEDQFCSMFDGLVKPTCEAFVHYGGPFIIKGLINKQNVDVICHGAGFCKDPKCKIMDQRTEDSFASTLYDLFDGQQKTFMHKVSPWKWLIDLFGDRFGDKHLPPFDMDNDTFSDISTFRGYHWKGVDCNELNANIYPGRKEGKTSSNDHDCNGIWGIDTKKQSYQAKLCSNWTRLGVAVAGDSAGAHFSIPQKFFNVTMMQKGSFHDLLPRLADQFDLPQESAYTGHTNTAYPTHSIYKHLRKWNMCNNNDFQNLGVNGGDSGNTWGNIKALHRNQTTDYPMLFFLQLIGNDVCGSSLDGMTTPAKFKQNILKLLEWLDTKLPKGSHVVILGLADGDLLFQYLHGTIHPLDVTYDTVYDFLNCLKISPCAGWLNTNQTAREYTTNQAKILSNVYKQILKQGTSYKNYDIVYHDFPIEDMFKRMYLEGRQPREMIQRCDGFHPSGLFNSYLADWLWYRIVTDHPEWIGDENPNNQQIKRLFGLQDLK